jgi:hypothetical protein
MSGKQKRLQNLRQAKDARMKKVAIGGAVLLVAVLAFEVPKMLHSGASTASQPPPATTTTGSSTTSAPGTTPAGTAAAAVTPVASPKLTNSDVQPKVEKSQLYSFSHFAGKDPFVQQVGNTSTSLPTPSPSTTSAPPPSAGTTAAVTHPAQSRTLAATGVARIAINGRVQLVRVGGSFPSANPLFRLVAVSHGVARIGIANGSYSSGARTVSLAVGRTMTLVDTADGIRYRLRLLPA